MITLNVTCMQTDGLSISYSGRGAETRLSIAEIHQAQFDGVPGRWKGRHSWMGCARRPRYRIRKIRTLQEQIQLGLESR